MEGSFPIDGMEMTHILVVSDLEASKQFYQNILGAELYREAGCCLLPGVARPGTNPRLRSKRRRIQTLSATL